MPSHTIPSNRSAVGERLFEVESGIIVGWFHECIDEYPTELFPYHWDEVGQPPARVVYGKGSGLPSVMVALESLGIEADEDQMREIVAAIKQRALRDEGPAPARGGRAACPRGARYRACAGAGRKPKLS